MSESLGNRGLLRGQPRRAWAFESGDTRTVRERSLNLARFTGEFSRSMPLSEQVPESMTLHEIYQRHADFVWRTLRRLGVREAEASDAVQDVFVVVHAKLGQFEGRSSMTTWLFTICRTVARERRRRAAR